MWVLCGESRSRDRSAALLPAFFAGKVDVDVATLRPFGIFLFRPPPWPTKVGLSSHLGRSFPAFYAGKVDVDVVTLRPFGRFLYGGP